MLFLFVSLIAVNVGNSDIFLEKDSEVFMQLIFDVNFNRVFLRVFQRKTLNVYLDLRIRRDHVY